MPPPNVSFATAVDIGALPVTTYSQADINDGGVNFTVYLKFTAPLSCTMVWAWIKSGNVGVGYRPSVIPYDASEVEILTENSHIPSDVPNRPIQFPVIPGAIHYLEVVKNVDTAGPELITGQVKVVPNDTSIPLESIIVNGDEITQPCGVFSPSTDYRTIKFVKDVAIGEGGCVTADGKVLFDNRVFGDRKVKLYDSNLAELGTNDILAFAWIRNNRTTGWFWILVMETAGTSMLYKLDPTVLPLAKALIATFTHGNSRGISVNSAETIAYFYPGSGNNLPIKRWDLTLDVAMADLAPSEGANFSILDTLYLSGDIIVAGWADNANNIARIKAYQPDGTVLNSVDFDSFEENYGITRLALAPDSPTHFWVKLREVSIPGAAGVPTGRSVFKKIKTSDFSVITTRFHLEYSGRNYIGPEAANLPGNGESGIWNSCPFVVAQIGNPEIIEGGILFGNPTLRHDVYPDQARKIPNPTVRTALIGD